MVGEGVAAFISESSVRPQVVVSCSIGVVVVCILEFREVMVSGGGIAGPC